MTAPADRRWLRNKPTSGRPDPASRIAHGLAGVGESDDRSCAADLAEASSLLRQAVATIDRLCNESRNFGPYRPLGMPLGEASHEIHRALIALDQHANT